MNYKIVKSKNKYSVVEIMTDHIIKEFTILQKATTLLKHLNSGGGFDSWTPAFFNIKVKT